MFILNFLAIPYLRGKFLFLTKVLKYFNYYTNPLFMHQSSENTNRVESKRNNRCPQFYDRVSEFYYSNSTF